MSEDPTENKTITFQGRFWIDRNAQVFLGQGRITLLEKIDSGHSIAEAARQLGMGYKTAWDMLNEMNNLSEEPLVIRTKGGYRGGGTTLTAYGKKMIALYRTIETEYQTMLHALEQRYPELNQWTQYKERIPLRTSARNQLCCKIQALEKKGHCISVTLNLGKQQFLKAMLTQASVDEMRLSVGQEVVILIKAPLISIATRPFTEVQMLEGTLTSLDIDEAGGAEAEILLQSGQTLVAVLEYVPDSVVSGAAVFVAIDPKQILLAII